MFSFDIYIFQDLIVVANDDDKKFTIIIAKSWPSHILGFSYDLLKYLLERFINKIMIKLL